MRTPADRGARRTLARPRMEERICSVRFSNVAEKRKLSQYQVVNGAVDITTKNDIPKDRLGQCYSHSEL